MPPMPPGSAGIASTLLFSICIVYVAATFRYPLPHPPPCDDDPYCISGTNEVGSLCGGCCF